MATGDAAVAAGMDILTGNEPANTLDTEINKSRDYIAERTSDITPITKGGTGADNADAARTNLGAVDAALLAPGNAAQANKIPTYNADAQLTTANPTLGGHAASKSYVDARPVGLPTSTPATDGYTVAYINSDGRLSKGASSERYKKFISEVDPAAMGDVWPDLVRYQMRFGDGAWKYGYIAERLNESDALRPFVVYQTVTQLDEETGEYTTTLAADDAGNPVPDSIDFISLLLVQNAQLHARLTALEADRP